MTESLKVENGHVVLFHYALSNGEGEQLDSSIGGEPLAYLHGAKNIVPGLERHMAGHMAGDKFTAVISPAEGYGEYQKPGPQPVERTAFPAEADLSVGASFHVESGDGHLFEVWVKKVEEDTVYVDANHPLAGVTLCFKVEVVEVRVASDEEVANGYVHGAGGHQH